MVKSVFAAVAFVLVCSAVTADARVTRIEIVKVERVEPSSPAVAGVPQAPPYERMSGKFYGELDPADPRNALITDIQFATRNARGKVEYVGTFSLMKPLDLSKASGVLIYSVVNRGNGAASASPEGHISLVSGWQGDVVPSATNQTIQVPRARNADGSSLVGPFVIRFVNQSGSTAPLIIPRATPTPYLPLSLDTTKAVPHESENRSLVLFDRGDEVVVQAGEAGIRFLLVSGRPIEEPVAWYGPIVMNTKAQLQQALSDLRDGTFITDPAPGR